jgi:hypothetical protein
MIFWRAYFFLRQKCNTAFERVSDYQWVDRQSQLPMLVRASLWLPFSARINLPVPNPAPKQNGVGDV